MNTYKFKISDVEDELLSTLNDFQRDQYDAIKWVIGTGPRASGRTHTLAIAFIIQAIHSGMDTPIWDHYPCHKDERFILDTIMRICDKLDIHMTVRRQDKAIRFIKFGERWTNHMVKRCEYCNEYHDTRIACREYRSRHEFETEDMFETMYDAMCRLKEKKK